MAGSHRAVETSFDVEDKKASRELAGSRSWENWTNLAAYLVNSIVTYSSMTGIYGATNTELSRKYQTLVTPAGWAFSIWGPIFIWELVFVVAQLLPQYCQSKVTRAVSPWWWGINAAQTLWTFAFAQDIVPLALVLMLTILVTLLGLAWSTDGLEMSTNEFFLLRAPFSLHLGWIIAASAVNLSVQADSNKAPQETLLALSIVSQAAILAIVTFFTFAAKSPDAIVGLVAAWAFAAVKSELGNPVRLNDPTRYNPSVWDSVVLGGLQRSALMVSLLSLGLAVVAIAFRVLNVIKPSAGSDDESEE